MYNATVKTIYTLIDEIAPFDTQEEFDNAGVLVGSMQDPVQHVLLALDVTPEVVAEAETLGASLVIAHHPLMFRAIQSLSTDDYEGKLLHSIAGSGLALISAHTNLDQTSLSGASVLAQRLGLMDITKPDRFLVEGRLPREMDTKRLGIHLAQVLGADVRMYGDPDTPVRRLAIAGGAYDEGWKSARQAGAQALLTGEVRYHNALEAAESGFVLFDGGHYHTEVCMMEILAQYLQKRLNDLQYKVAVSLSAVHHFAEGLTLKEAE
ncbi:MAG: Nif3-like dinuclear metal center hexameric protein [Clostridiales bacterium]|nr:Nif3-like dinuclear metal center hexameric protein [Clostridiales bacterium]